MRVKVAKKFAPSQIRRKYDRKMRKKRPRFYLFQPVICDTYTSLGSCVLKASVDRVSVDTLGRYVDRQSADVSTDTRPICRPRLGRYIGRLSVDTHVGRHPPILHRHSADTRPILHRHSASTTLIWSALVTEFYLLYSTVR